MFHLKPTLFPASLGGVKNPEPFVLIVEDMPVDAMILERMLRKVEVLGQIRVLSAGNAALDYLAGHPPYEDRKTNPLPSFIFLDMQLPDMSGLEILSRIKSQPALSHIPVVMHSDGRNPSEIKALYAAGAASYLRKSNNLEDLKEIVQHFGQYFTLAS